MPLRKHQAEMRQVCREIKSGSSEVRQILTSTTPGGGKEVAAIVAASELIPSVADAICWVVPRNNLRRQAEKSFLDALWRIELPHNLSIRASTNEINPCRGCAGYVTTYQAIGQNPDVHRDEFERRRYILFLDEPHHVEEGGQWHRALQPLVDRAAIVVYASGTFERGDGRHIAFIPYRKIANGDTVDFSRSDTCEVIKYTRRDALREKAIVPLHFEVMDGRAEWVNVDGVHCSTDSIAEAGDDTSPALFTALRTEFAFQLLEKTIKSWRDHKHLYSKAKLLVVAPGITAGKEYLRWLTTQNISADIATSDDSEAASLAIARFKAEPGKREIDVLVTVQMAYEGMSVKEITHIACLTHIRSKPWLEQCWARANRTDKGKTHGYIFGPDDALFRQVMHDVKEDQEAVVKERAYTVSEGGESRETVADYPENIPLGSELTRERAIGLEHNEETTYEETARIISAMESAQIAGVSPLQMRNFMLQMGVATLPNGPGPINRNDPILTPSEQERRLKQSIERYIRKYAYNRGISPRELNEDIKTHFRKSRDEMTVEELGQVWAYVQRHYPGVLV